MPAAMAPATTRMDASSKAQENGRSSGKLTKTNQVQTIMQRVMLAPPPVCIIFFLSLNLGRFFRKRKGWEKRGRGGCFSVFFFLSFLFSFLL